MKEPTKVQAHHPERLFLSNELVEKVGLIQTAIISDLYYWFLKGENPWRTYQNWSEWLSVSERTIGTQVNNLNLKGIINRKRTRLPNGGQGAYKFSLTSHENSKYIYSMYKNVFSNKYSDNDLGTLEQNYVNKPKFQMVYLKSIDKLGGLTLAYIINSLAWYAANLGTREVQYNSTSSLASRLNIKRNTLQRGLDRLEKNNLLISAREGQKIAIQLLNDAYHVQESFSNWLEDVREKRIEAFSQSL